MSALVAGLLIGALVELLVTARGIRRERRRRIERNRQAARNLQDLGYDVTPPWMIRHERDPVLRDTAWNRALHELNRR